MRGRSLRWWKGPGSLEKQATGVSPYLSLHDTKGLLRRPRPILIRRRRVELLTCGSSSRQEITSGDPKPLLALEVLGVR